MAANAEALRFQVDQHKRQGDRLTLADQLIRHGVLPARVHGVVANRLFGPVARFLLALRSRCTGTPDWDAEWLLAECLGRCRNPAQVEQCYAEYQANPGREHRALEVVFFQPSLGYVQEVYTELWDCRFEPESAGLRDRALSQPTT